MIQAIVIDDEPKAISIVQVHAAKVEQLNLVESFYNPHQALSFLKENPIDLIFLDINMPHLSGLELLEKLKVKPLIIFTTAYSEFATESYTLNAVDYLLKPFNFERFQMAVQKASMRLEANKPQTDFFFLKDGSTTSKLNFDDILFIKGSGNYLDITTLEKVYSPRMTFAEILAKLPSSNFLRVHQSYVVNLAHIEKIEYNHIYVGTEKITISRMYKVNFLKRLGLEQ